MNGYGLRDAISKTIKWLKSGKLLDENYIRHIDLDSDEVHDWMEHVLPKLISWGTCFYGYKLNNKGHINYECHFCGNNRLMVLKSPRELFDDIVDGDIVICCDCGQMGYISADPEDEFYIVWFNELPVDKENNTD